MKNVHSTLRSNQEIAPNIFRLELSSPEEFSIQPGQFVMLKVGSSFDPLLRRPFAALARNGGSMLEIYYKVAGRGTALLASLPADTAVDVLGPLGRGFSVPPDKWCMLLVAGGMGIVPLTGLVEHLARLGTKRLHLFLGAQSADHLLFADCLRDLGATLHVATEDGSRGFHGLVTDCLEHALINDHQLAVDQAAGFACGPQQFLKAMARIAGQYQFPCQVSLEARMACGIGACLGCVVRKAAPDGMPSGVQQYDRVCMEGPVFDIQDIAW